jgi:hypothetical protein
VVPPRGCLVFLDAPTRAGGDRHGSPLSGLSTCTARAVRLAAPILRGVVAYPKFQEN